MSCRRRSADDARQNRSGGAWDCGSLRRSSGANQRQSEADDARLARFRRKFGQRAAGPGPCAWLTEVQQYMVETVFDAEDVRGDLSRVEPQLRRLLAEELGSDSKLARYWGVLRAARAAEAGPTLGRAEVCRAAAGVVGGGWCLV